MVKWFVEWVSGRVDRKQDRVDEAVQQLITGLQEQVSAVAADNRQLREDMKVLEADLHECKRRHSESDAEVMRLKAMLQGYGDARNVAQIEIAAKKREAKG